MVRGNHDISLKKLLRFIKWEYNSSNPIQQCTEHPLKVQARTGQENPGKTRKDIDVQKPSDDEDYFYDDVTNGSGDGANHEPENKSQVT